MNYLLQDQTIVRFDHEVHFCVFGGLEFTVLSVSRTVLAHRQTQHSVLRKTLLHSMLEIDL